MTAPQQHASATLELLGKVEGIFAPEKKQIETINGGDFLANLDMTDEDDSDTLQ